MSTIAIVASLAVLLNPSHAQTDVDDSRGVRIAAFVESYFSRHLKEMTIPGAVLVIIDNDQPIVTQAWGYADEARKLPATINKTAFRLGSVGKTFTALAALQLINRNQLQMDAPIAEHLPEFTALKPTTTMRCLLLHTAGFEDRIIGYSSSAAAPYPDLGAHLRAHLPQQMDQLVDLPAYSNYGYALAGLVVERVAGRPFRRYVEYDIFAPLGMSSSFYAVPPLDTRGTTLATEYFASGDVYPKSFSSPYPAGGVGTTALDMQRFMLAFLAAHRGAGNAIGQAARQMAYTQATRVPGVEGEGFGLNAQIFGGQRVWMKGGAAPKHSAVLAFMPERGAAILVAINRQEPRFWKGFLLEFLSTFHSATAQPASLTANPQQFSGHYQLTRANYTTIESIASPLLQVEVVAESHGIRLRPIISGWTYPRIFMPADNNVFRTEEQYVAFAPASKGGTMFMNVDGDHFSLRPLSWWQRADVVAFAAAASLALVLSFPLVRLIALTVAAIAGRPSSPLHTRWGYSLNGAALFLVGAVGTCIAQLDDLPFGPTPALYAVSSVSSLFTLSTGLYCLSLARH